MRVAIVLRVEDRDVRGLRRLLKILLRRFGMRCEAIEVVETQDEKETK